MAERGGESRGQVPGWAFVLLSLAGVVFALTLVPRVASGEVLRVAIPWLPSFGVQFSFFVDGLSLLFALLITGIGVFIGLYARAYMHGHAQTGAFFCYLIFFQASMLGLVLADNIITLFVFWELTTVSSFLLIGFDHASEKARRNAWQALLVTGAGGLALLAGLLLLAQAGGSMELSELMTAESGVQEHPLYLGILVLILLGAFTKSAQVPFHFWLPNAMAAPTPVSAYLHSATMVKAGIYLLARVHPSLSGTPEWIWTLTIFGAVTAVWASIVAMRQTDLKLALAYTTVMALGTLTMFLGSEAHIAITAAMTFLVVHCLYKSALFMVIGIIDHETGTREVDRLGGLFRAMPITAVAAAAAAFSMAGFPPFLGFIGKELKYEGALAVASEPLLVAGAAIAANALMVGLAAVVAIRPFYGAPRTYDRTPHRPPFGMWIGPVFMALLGLTFGVGPEYVGNLLINPAANAVAGIQKDVKFALWHGVNIPLMMSIVTVALGVVVFIFSDTLRRWLASALGHLLTGDEAYDGVKGAILKLADVQTAILQNGSLRRYLFVVFAVTAAGVGGTLIAEGGMAWPALWPDVPIYEWAIVVLIAAGAVVPMAARSRLAGICGLGTVGSGVALIFLIYGAPDVAKTQLLVEVLFVVMISVVFLKLPRFAETTHPPKRGRLGDLTLAAISGGVMTLMTLAVLDTPLNDHLTKYFEANSVPGGQGGNIVNVILVDFRALDTFGEIVVVAVAALGAFGLIKLRSTRAGGS